MIDDITKEKLAAALKKREEKFKDRRYLSVMSFLCAKGLLHADNIKILRGNQVKIKDALWVAENVEPRVLEVLPAAVLHFPRAFSDYGKMPKEVKDVVTAMKNQGIEGPNLRWVNFQTLKRWGDFATSDRRVRPLSEKRLARTFRLRKETIDQIKKIAQEASVSEGAVIDERFKL